MNIENIIELCKKDNRNAQKLLFDTYAGKMMTLCRRYAIDESEAKDIMQEGFINVYLGIASFKGSGSFEGWMRSIFVHTAIRFRKKFKITFEELDFSESLDSENTTTNEGPDQMTTDEIIEVINQLPEGYKMVFNLFVFEGLNHKEISNILKIKESTSRSQLHKAKSQLKKIMFKYFVIYFLIVLFLTKL